MGMTFPLYVVVYEHALPVGRSNIPDTGTPRRQVMYYHCTLVCMCVPDTTYHSCIRFCGLLQCEVIIYIYFFTNNTETAKYFSETARKQKYTSIFRKVF